MDNLRNPDSAVAARNSYFVYHGRSDPYSARYCHYRSAGTGHSRAKGPVGFVCWQTGLYQQSEGRTVMRPFCLPAIADIFIEDNGLN